MKTVLLVIALFTCSSLAAIGFDPLVPVQTLDLAKYSGLWYEIGRINYIFEEKCQCVIANYTLDSQEGYVKVVNTCNWGAPDGKIHQQAGKAYPDDPVNGTVTTGRLSVQFFEFIKADYYVIDLDENYQTALVGGPSRKSLFILSRTPTISDDLYNELLKKATADEFDVSTVIRTYQGSDCPQY